jgi:hypothetical protein
MIRTLIAAALLCPVAAFAGNVFTSTPHEARNMNDARNICNWKSNMLVQAYGDRDAGIPYDAEVRRLHAVTQSAVSQGARFDLSDTDDLVQMAYTSDQPVLQARASFLQVCMTPFAAGFEATQTPYWLNQ